jgi:hypothetical protein
MRPAGAAVGMNLKTFSAAIALDLETVPDSNRYFYTHLTKPKEEDHDSCC